MKRVFKPSVGFDSFIKNRGKGTGIYLITKAKKIDKKGIKTEKKGTFWLLLTIFCVIIDNKKAFFVSFVLLWSCFGPLVVRVFIRMRSAVDTRSPLTT
ncbi:MAG: hypothetical protein J6Y00_00445 [Paludibacteraceae bacterium]|nr:hypothetical protein [Paludibacteraceae bacterium]